MLHLLTFLLTPSWAVFKFAVFVPSNKNNSLEIHVPFCKGMFLLCVDQTFLKSTFNMHISLFPIGWICIATFSRKRQKP